MGAEPVAGLIILVAADVVVKGPGSAGAMHEMPDVLLLVAPEATDAAQLPVLLPGGGIDVASLVQRSDEFVAVPGRTVGKLLRTGEVQSDRLQAQLCAHHAPPSSFRSATDRGGCRYLSSRV